VYRRRIAVDELDSTRYAAESPFDCFRAEALPLDMPPKWNNPLRRYVDVCICLPLPVSLEQGFTQFLSGFLEANLDSIQDLDNAGMTQCSELLDGITCEG
jgi:hypothetical protein